MLQYDRIDIKKCKETSRECNLYKFYYFLDKNFNYGPYLCDGCYDISLKAINMKNLAIVYRGEQAYHVNFAFMSKNGAFNLIKRNIINKKINKFLYVHSVKMSPKTINFGDKEINRKEFYSSKQAISLDSVDLDKIVVSNKWEINDTTYKYLCGYLNNDVIQPLCVILLQMNGNIKYLMMVEKICHLLQMMRKSIKSIMKYGKKLENF